MTAKTSTQRSEAHRNREKAKVARMREALRTVVGDCQLAYDALGNSPPQFDSVREGFKIIGDRALTALQDTKA